MVLRIRSEFVRLLKDESGASLLEYSILIGLITGGVVAIVAGAGTWVVGRWTALKTALAF
jgi:pilus assembly protein Flp/PilA